MAMIDFNELHTLVLHAPAGSVVVVSFLDGVSLMLHAPSASQRDDIEDPSVSFTRLSSILRTAAPGTAARIAFPDGLNLSVSTNSRGRLYQTPNETLTPSFVPAATLDNSTLAPPTVPLASQTSASPEVSHPTERAPEKNFEAPNATPAQPKHPPPPLDSSDSHSPDRSKRVERRPRFGERPIVGSARGLEVGSGLGEGTPSMSGEASEPCTPATPSRATHRHTSLSPSGRRSHRKLHQIPREERRAMLQAAKSAHETSSWSGRARSLSSGDVASFGPRQRRAYPSSAANGGGNGARDANEMPASAEPLYRGARRHRSWAVAEKQPEEGELLDKSSDYIVTPSRRKPRHMRVHARNGHRELSNDSNRNDSTALNVSSEAQREALSAVARLAEAIDSRRWESQAAFNTVNASRTTVKSATEAAPTSKADPEPTKRSVAAGTRPETEPDVPEVALDNSPTCFKPVATTSSSQAPNPFEALAAAANQSAAPRPASPPSWPEMATAMVHVGGVDDEASPKSAESCAAAAKEEIALVVEGEGIEAYRETPVWRQAAEYWARQLTSPEGSQTRASSEAFHDQTGLEPQPETFTAAIAAARSSHAAEESRPEAPQLAMGGPPIVGAKQRGYSSAAVGSTTAPAAPHSAAAIRNTSSPPVPSELAGFAVWAPPPNKQQPRSPAKVLRVSPQPLAALRPTPERPAKKCPHPHSGDAAAAAASPPVQGMRNGERSNPFEKSSLDHSPLTSPFESPLPNAKHASPPIGQRALLDAVATAARSPHRLPSSNDAVEAAAKKLEVEASIASSAAEDDGRAAAAGAESAMGGPPVTSPSSQRSSAPRQHHETFVVQFTGGISGSGGRNARAENSHVRLVDRPSEYPLGTSLSHEQRESFQAMSEESLQQGHPESPQFTEEHKNAMSRCIENLTPQEALRIHNHSVNNRDEDDVDYGSSDEVFQHAVKLPLKSSWDNSTSDDSKDQNEEWFARGPWYV